MNLIGEHTDYNDGLCLPFAIERGVTVRAEPSARGREIEAHALDLGGARLASSWARSGPAQLVAGARFVRGAAGELQREGIELRPCRLEFEGDLPRGAGLSSSAALSISLCLALCARQRGRAARPRWRSPASARGSRTTGAARRPACSTSSPRCARSAGTRVRIDMRGPKLRAVPLDSGRPCAGHARLGRLAQPRESGYNERRAECREACERSGVGSLRDAPSADGLPDPLDRRVRHVITENERVDAAVDALESGDLAELGRLLDASHASLRDDYEVSVPEVERAVAACKRAGALGARIMGGGFGGSVLALFPPGASAPARAVRVQPGPPARLL